MHFARYILLVLALLLAVDSARGKVLRVEVESRESVLDRKTFGPYGAYELLRGRIYFGIDPANPANDAVVDIERAPRNADGLVEAWANFVVLQPADPDQRRGVALVEVSNRGGKFSPSYFNRAGNSSLNPEDPGAFGDALLMREGLTVIWIGWQYDVPREEDVLRLRVPRARHGDGSPIMGLVRSDWVVDEPQTTLALGHRDHVAYPVADFDHPDNVLTARFGRTAPRDTVPQSAWRFARETEGGDVVSDSTHIYLKGGFGAGKIYELVYRAQDPAVVGLGLAAIRDVIAYAKHDDESLFPVRHGLAVGVSQTGRFLRHFLYQGFNTDEEGRPAYDGLMVITAGAGRGSFNHRFAQPSRDAHRYSAFFYPTDIFPFASRALQDPKQWRTDGLLAHLHDAEHAPKTFYINTGYEYWGRAASLIHTTPTAEEEDVAPLPNERIYHLAGAQHFPWQFPPPDEMLLREAPDLYRGNPLDFSVNYRALLVRLVEWVDQGEEPPPSAYPRLEEDTLVPVEEMAFPEIPGMDAPEVVHRAYRADYGPRWLTEGIIDLQPPRLGEPFPMRVPQVDSLGNEVGGVQNVELRVPLATYMPWNLRLDAPASTEELTDFFGSYAPLPRTPEEKEATDDPRPALSALYDGEEDYMRQVQKAAQALVDEGFLLPDDRPRVIERAEAYWRWLFDGTSRE